MKRCLIAFNQFSCELIIPAHSTCVKWSGLGDSERTNDAHFVSPAWKKNKVEVGRNINSSEPKVCEKFFVFVFLFSVYFFFASDVICLENLWSQSEGTHSRGRAEHWRMTDRTTIKYQMLVTKEAQRNIDLLRSLLRSFYTCHINFHEVVSLFTSPPLPW